VIAMFKFITILLIQVLCGMEMDLFIPSFPELQKVFVLSPFMVQMTISINFLCFCVCSLFAGALGDRFNRRVILLLGLCIFIMGSLLCVVAPNYVVLILGRAIQGIGISAPAILSFPILLDSYTIEKQPGMMGTINGIKTLAMAVAPLIGSFVNLYFGWRGNFTLLLAFGVLCLVISFLFIPDKKGNQTISLSLRAYSPILKAPAYLNLLFALSLVTSAYWMFMGMAPLLFMDNMGVSLKHFGYYQGSLSLTFALVCVFSSPLLNIFGRRHCFYVGLAICFLSALLIIGLIVFQIHQPLLITAVLVLFSIGIVFPINILYPVILKVIPGAESRASGLGQAVVLLLTAMMLQSVGFFYNGTFMPIGITMFISIMLSLILVRNIINKKWLVFTS